MTHPNVFVCLEKVRYDRPGLSILGFEVLTQQGERTAIFIVEPNAQAQPEPLAGVDETGGLTGDLRATVLCPSCQGELRRVHRRLYERLRWSAVLECRQCRRRVGRPRTGRISG